MRVAHVTDVHWFVPPNVGEMSFKRVIGSANLYLRGRRHHFTDEVQEALMAHLLALEPDLVLLTGDLTAQALPAEFEKARLALDPVLEAFPTLVLPGNHDVYTPEAVADRLMEAWFGRWMGLEPGPLARLDLGSVTVLGLDPNRPTWFSAAGRIPETQLEALAEALADPGLADRFVILALHYPVLDRHAEVYDNPNHGLRNARVLIDLLGRAPHRPGLLIHGHEHHGFHVDLELADGHRVPIHNCGSSGYAWMPDLRRAAAMNVYEVDGARLAGVQRYLYDGGGFAPEPGGAYATGR